MAWALRARAPVAAGSLPRATRSAPKAGALRARAPTCAPRVTAHVVSWGGVGMSKTSCAARCSRGSVQGVLRAPAEGEGGVAHREDLAATASATLERSAGTVAHGKRAARERRRRPARTCFSELEARQGGSDMIECLPGAHRPGSAWGCSVLELPASKSTTYFSSYRGHFSASPATKERFRSLKLASTATDS